MDLRTTLDSDEIILTVKSSNVNKPYISQSSSPLSSNSVATCSSSKRLAPSNATKNGGSSKDSSDLNNFYFPESQKRQTNSEMLFVKL